MSSRGTIHQSQASRVRATSLAFTESTFSRGKLSWWRHQMETFSALLVICAGNSPVSGEFPAQRPVTQSFDGFFDQRPNKGLSKQSWGWQFETHSSPLWRHSNGDVWIPDLFVGSLGQHRSENNSTANIFIYIFFKPYTHISYVDFAMSMLIVIKRFLSRWCDKSVTIWAEQNYVYVVNVMCLLIALLLSYTLQLHFWKTDVAPM